MKINFMNTKDIYSKSGNKQVTHDNTAQNYYEVNPSYENVRAYAIINFGRGDYNMTDREYIELRDEFSRELEPKKLKADIDDWNFYINSTDENRSIQEESSDAYYDLFKNEDLYNRFQSLNKRGLSDPHLAKQLKKLLRSFDEECNSGELKKALRNKENEIAAKYNSYVPMIDGKETSKTEIGKLLQEESNVDLRKKAYDARIKGGDLIADDMVEFVKMRNEFARTKGYKNYFEYALREDFDVDPKQLEVLMNDVYNRAKGTIASIQSEKRQELAQEYGIDASDLMQYHYGLLLDSNPEKEVNKSIKTKEQVEDIAKKAYKNMGYDIDNMPIILDLYPRKNKNTHGFCFDIQMGKDARILANLTNDSYSIDTLCHELGHCVYCLGVDTALPYLDREYTPALTEAIAMMMGDLQQKEDVLKGIVPDETLEKFKAEHKKSEANFICRSMLIIEFEKRMYENPDQDLKQLWHDMRVKYMGANDSEELNNEWATIPHYLSHPAYYQNYFRADLMKAQMYSSLHSKLGNLTENEETAEYLNNNLFKYGMSIDENDLIEQFTGEPLSGKALCESFK